jgi:hypothetical protein
MDHVDWGMKNRLARIFARGEKGRGGAANLARPFAEIVAKAKPAHFAMVNAERIARGKILPFAWMTSRQTLSPFLTRLPDKYI